MPIDVPNKNPASSNAPAAALLAAVDVLEKAAVKYRLSGSAEWKGVGQRTAPQSKRVYLDGSKVNTL